MAFKQIGYKNIPFDHVEADENRASRICPATQIEFTPKRNNQIYSSRAVQIKHNNLQAKLRNSELKKLNDAVKLNAKKLEKLYNYMVEQNWNCISVEYMEYEKFDRAIFSSVNKDQLNENLVSWCLNYGFSPVDITLKFYFLYKKQ